MLTRVPQGARVSRVRGKVSARIQDLYTAHRTNIEAVVGGSAGDHTVHTARPHVATTCPESKVEFNTWPQY